MKKYYKLTQSENDEYYIATDLVLSDDPSGGISTFKLGREIIVPVPNPLELDLDGLNGGIPRHYIEGAGIVAISGLFLKALHAAGVDNFRIFPSVLRDVKTGRKWTNYYGFNEVGCIDAALLEECEYDVLFDHGEDSEHPPLLDFDHVVLSAKKLKKGYNMFRLVHSPSHHLYIDGDVLGVLKKLSPPEKWGCACEEVEIK